MKRYKNLWEKFCTYENAVKAIKLGTKHKKQNYRVKKLVCYDDVEHNSELDPFKVDELARELVCMLEKDIWNPSSCRHITKYFPSTGKTREIDCPRLLDHIVQWMLILAIEEPLCRGMYKFSCGSIPKRGIEYARKHIESWVRKDNKSAWFVKLDIKKFYESVDHNILKSMFRRVIKDERVLNVIDKVVDTVEHGLPIGSYTSQWFANFMLQGIDHYIKEQLYKTRRGKRVNHIRHYVRYMDDMLLIGASKSDLNKSVNSIIDKLKSELNLTIKPCWEIKSTKQYPVDMIGYRFFKHYTEMRGKIFLHTKRLAKKIYKAKRKTGKTSLYHAQSMVSLIGWAKHCDSQCFIKKYINPFVNIKDMEEVISNENKKHSITASTCNR